MKTLYLDVETAGLKAEECGLTQLAFIIEIDGVERVSGAYDIKPFEGSSIERKALEVTGKTYDEVMSYPDEAKVFNTFIAVLKEFINPMVYGDDFTLVAYNAEFDQRFLIAWFERMGKKYSNYINYKKVDPLALLRILDHEGIANLSSYKLSVVYSAVFNEEFKAHDAQYDIDATRKLYKYLVSTYIVGGNV